MATEDQINAVSTSQDNLDANGTEQDAQNFMAANSLGQSQEQVISIIDSTYKGIKLIPFWLGLRMISMELKMPYLIKLLPRSLKKNFKILLKCSKLITRP